jgi:RNA binding exosome subunit
MLQMAAEDIIRGITLVNPNEHAVIQTYQSRIPEAIPSVLVVEMETIRARHLGNKLMVFAGKIAEEEYKWRVLHHSRDPEGYRRKHIESLGKQNAWHS